MTETRFWYWEPKPRSNFGIGIGAKTFFSETETFFFNFFQIFSCFLLIGRIWVLKTKFAAKSYFFFQIIAYKNLYPKKRSRKHVKNLNFFQMFCFGFGKKKIGSNTDTEIGPWFRFPIPKPGFGRTLLLPRNFWVF